MSAFALLLWFFAGMVSFGLIAIGAVLCWYLRTERKILDREDLRP